MKINLTEMSEELKALIKPDRKVWVLREMDPHIVEYILKHNKGSYRFISKPSDVKDIKDPNVDIAIIQRDNSNDIQNYTFSDTQKINSNRLLEVMELVDIKEGYLPINVEACTTREATGYTSLTSQQIAALYSNSPALGTAIIKASIPSKVSLALFLKSQYNNTGFHKEIKSDIEQYNLESYIEQLIDRCIGNQPEIINLYSPLIELFKSPKDILYIHESNEVTSRIKGLIYNSTKTIDIYKFIESLRDTFPMGLYISSDTLIDKSLNLKSNFTFLDFHLLLSKLRPSGVNIDHDKPNEPSFDIINLCNCIHRVITSCVIFKPSPVLDINSYVSLYLKIHKALSFIKNQLSLFVPITYSIDSLSTNNSFIVKRFSRYGGNHVFTGKLKTSEMVGTLLFHSPTDEVVTLPVVYLHPDCAITELLSLKPLKSIDEGQSTFFLRNNIIALGRSPMGSWLFAVAIPSYEYGYIGHVHVSSLLASQAHASDGDGDPCSIFKVSSFLHDFDIEQVVQWNQSYMSLGGDDNSYLDFISHSKTHKDIPITSSLSIDDYVNVIDKVSRHYLINVGSAYNTGSAISFASSVNPELTSACNIAWRGLYEQQALSGWSPNRESVFNLLTSTKLPSLPVFSSKQPDGSYNFSINLEHSNSTPVQPISQLAEMLNCSNKEARTIFSFTISKSPVERLCRELSKGVVSKPITPEETISLPILDSLLWNYILSHLH